MSPHYIAWLASTIACLRVEALCELYAKALYAKAYNDQA